MLLCFTLHSQSDKSKVTMHEYKHRGYSTSGRISISSKSICIPATQTDRGARWQNELYVARARARAQKLKISSTFKFHAA